ncbi:MAG: histidinol dehydrogenase, partial [Nitrospirota bacterium]
MKIIDTCQNDITNELKRIINRGEMATEEVAATVKEIVERVRREGDPAVIEYTEKFDKAAVSLKDIRVSAEDIKNAYTNAQPQNIDALRKAATNIRSFHEKQKLSSWVTEENNGVILGNLVRPIRSVGIYVPGGKASYPSSVLMNAIPATVAGVEQIIMCCPAPGGALNPYILIAADIVGITEIYKIGGAQAIAAMAYGTASIPKVDKIVGPGNIYVATAKRYVFGQVDIDMIAGPSEIVVIADQTADSVFVAADLLSQAEHDELASAILITPSRELAQKVDAEIELQLATLGRKEIIRKSLDRFGAIIITSSLEDAADISNSLAPEHLELAVEKPFDLLSRIKNAGAIFLGHYSPEPVGDYFAG